MTNNIFMTIKEFQELASMVRRATGYGQETVAHCCETTRITIDRFERGITKHPRASILEWYSNAYIDVVHEMMGYECIAHDFDEEFVRFQFAYMYDDLYDYDDMEEDIEEDMEEDIDDCPLSGEDYLDEIEHMVDNIPYLAPDTGELFD